MKLEDIEKLLDKALPGPWEFDPTSEKQYADIVYYEPFTDDSEGRGSMFQVIPRDSGVYLKHMPTCEFIIAARTLMPKLLKIAKLAKFVSTDVDLIYEDHSGDLNRLLHLIEAMENS